ncbi:MAG: chromosomal replication initiator protein DnaA [Ignavibacteriales bacterium]|nr:chromosomal replication initiator protein DnaA [Ignavibacteriales bacterium]
MDILIVDDIQFFAGKEKTQDNFFHTFNALQQLGKQIVLSSDVPPKELKGLDERLISRFQCGLTADIQPPDLETRIAILQKKSQENGIELPSDVVDFISANVKNNIRELEGVLISMLARASLENRELNTELARDVLKIVVHELRAPITIEQIQRIVCRVLRSSRRSSCAQRRESRKWSSRGRSAMFLAKELTNSSLKTIGLHFGGRDHSTVIHACQAVDEHASTNEEFRKQIEALRRLIGTR